MATTQPRQLPHTPVFVGIDGQRRKAEEHLWHLREQLLEHAGDYVMISRIREDVERFTEIVAFDKRCPPGTRVRYWRMVMEGEADGEAPTRSSGDLLGGHTPVVWIEGVRGPIALTHVLPASE